MGLKIKGFNFFVCSQQIIIGKEKNFHFRDKNDNLSFFSKLSQLLCYKSLISDDKIFEKWFLPL